MSYVPHTEEEKRRMLGALGLRSIDDLFDPIPAELQFRQRLNVPVMMGVGGSFDVLTGYIQRAPVWMQSIGMEWSWRLAMEPRKMWKRYLFTNTEFLLMTAGVVAKRRLGIGRSL